jgi:hypothetical protein
VRELVQQLRGLPTIVRDDLAAFEAWLHRHDGDRRRANIACVFTTDADGALRVCLHPKAVRARVEFNHLEALQMLEGDILTLITIRSTNNAPPITLQPLICADALQLSTDGVAGNPLRALAIHNHLFDTSIVDIVSVAMCSPQVVEPAGQCRWHKEFTDALSRATQEDAFIHHRHAAFILSNFHNVPQAAPATPRAGGLSGAYLPLPVVRQAFPPYTALYVYGRSQLSELVWAPRSPGDTSAFLEHSNQAHLIYLSRGALDNVDWSVSVLGFTIDRLPQFADRIRGPQGTTDLCLETASTEQLSGELALLRGIEPVAGASCGAAA